MSQVESVPDLFADHPAVARELRGAGGVSVPAPVPTRAELRRRQRREEAPRVTGPRSLVPRSFRAQCAAVGLIWLFVILVAPRLDLPPGLRKVAVFVHLASLVVGFGAVLAVEWCGLLWLSGRRTLGDVLRTARDSQVPIWLGLGGLVASGALLSPWLTSRMWVKLVAVLVVAINGLVIARLQRRFEAAGPRGRRSLYVPAVLCSAVSQAAWWTAVVIGFLISHR